MNRKKKSKKRGTKKKKVSIDNAVVSHCKDCKKKLKAGNRHHFRCHKCWREYQIKKGDLRYAYSKD